MKRDPPNCCSQLMMVCRPFVSKVVLVKATYTHNLHTKNAERKKCREDEDILKLQEKSAASPVHRVLLPEISVASPVHRVLLPDYQKKPKPGVSGSQPGTPGAVTGKVGSQPGTPGAATGLTEDVETRRIR